MPSTVPSKPAGNNRRNSALSRSANISLSPITSITNSKGSMIAAACGTGMPNAISGVASAPKPEAKPLLASPISKTAGMATA